METGKLTEIANDSRKLDQWVRALPANNVASAGRDLLRMLAAILSSDMEPTFRLAQADLAAIGLQPISDALCLAIEDGAHASQARANVLAPIVDGLCLALNDIYRMLAVAEEPAGLLKMGRGGQTKVVAGHRILFYGLMVLRNHRNLGREAPKGLWKDIHSVYMRAAAHPGQLKKEVGHSHLQKYPESSLENAYKQCLLAQNLNPTGLGMGHCNEIAEALPYWASLVDLHPCRGGILNRELYRFVVPGYDAGPVPYSQPLLEEPGAMWIDTGRLDEKIVELYRRMLNEKADSADLPDGHTVSMNTLGSLKACWIVEGVARAGGEVSESADDLDWLESLSLTDVRDSSRQIHQRLKLMNAKRVPLARRYQILCRLIEPSEVVLNNLSKRYGEIFFPLPDRILRISGVMDDIAQMLVEGWQLVLEEWHASTWLFKSTHPAIQRIAVYRIFHYSEILITNHLLLKQPQREGVWLRLHRLMLAGQREEWAEQPLQKFPEKGGSAPSVQQIYRGILLLSLINMQGLRKEQIDQVKNSLMFWSDLLRVVSRKEDPKGTNYPFYVAPAKDLPPSNTPHICNEGDGDCLMLDVIELQSRLGEIIEKAVEKKLELVPLPTEEGVNISLSTLRYLSVTWQQSTNRKGDRKPTATEYQALFSIGSSHYVLREGEAQPQVKPEHSEEVVERKQEGQEFNPGAVAHGHDDSVIRQDVWETIMPNTELPEEEAWTPEADYSRYRFATIAIHDYSTGGCRFSFTPREDQRVRIGDIISMRKGEGRDILCGYVRWVSPAGDSDLMVGLQFLIHRLDPVWLLADNGDGRETRLPALLGDGVHNDKATLILPPIPGIRKRRLRLALGEKEFGIYLAGLPEQQSPSFEAFRFGVVNLERKKKLVSEKQLTTRVLANLDPATEIPQQKSVSEVDSVWDLI